MGSASPLQTTRSANVGVHRTVRTEPPTTTGADAGFESDASPCEHTGGSVTRYGVPDGHASPNRAAFSRGTWPITRADGEVRLMTVSPDALLTGLSSEEAARLLGTEGPNELPTAQKRNPLQQAWAVVRQPMLLLDVVYALLSLTVVRDGSRRRRDAGLARTNTHGPVPRLVRPAWSGIDRVRCGDRRGCRFAAHTSTLVVTITVTIALSVFAHGMSAAPLARRYASWHAATASPMESAPAHEQRWRHRFRQRVLTCERVEQPGHGALPQVRWSRRACPAISRR